MTLKIFFFSGELKQTCGGKLALAGTTFTNDFKNFQNAWNSQSDEMRFQTPVLPEACRNFTGPVGELIFQYVINNYC